MRNTRLKNADELKAIMKATGLSSPQQLHSVMSPFHPESRPSTGQAVQPVCHNLKEID